jgi:hypothetical protein
MRDASDLALKSLYPPAFCIFFLIICYNPLFDAWNWSLWLTLPFAAVCAAVIWNAFALSRKANQVRTQLIDGLVKERNEIGEAEDSANIKDRVEELRTVRGGAYTNFLDMPLVHAVMLPLSGAGGLTALQYVVPGMSG